MLLDPDVTGLSGAALVSVTLEQQGRATLDRFEQDERLGLPAARRVLRRARLPPPTRIW